MKVCYRGDAFAGWQVQPNKPTVQSHLEQALRQITSNSVRVMGASRTDTGVHALGQVLTVSLSTHHEPRTLLRSLNALLPDEIGVLEIVPETGDFHPIRDAMGKAYCYRFWHDQTPHPFWIPYVWHHYGDIDWSLVEQAMEYFVGTHDFTSFCAGDASAKTRTRQIFEIKLCKSAPLYSLYLTGNGFLKQMVRVIVGTLIQCGRGRLRPDEIPNILAAKDRRAAGPTAPPNGLCLVEIFYDRIHSIAEVEKRCWPNLP